MVIQHLVTTLQHMSDVRLIMVLRGTVEEFPENKLKKLVDGERKKSLHVLLLHYNKYLRVQIVSDLK